MAAATWMSLLRARVLEAEVACSQVPGLLDTVWERLRDPLHRGDAAADGVARIGAALDALRRASSNLAYAMPRMGASRELALRGGSSLPPLPLYSIDQLPGQYVAERNAVAKLDKGRARAWRVYVAVEKCREHLFVADFLISHQAWQGIPGVDGFIEAQRVAAIDDVLNASHLAKECAYLARGAHDDVVAGIN